MRVRALLILAVVLLALYAAGLVFFVAPRVQSGYVILWLGLGALLITLTLMLLRRRLWTPLARLEAGLARVADGDLNARLAVHGTDELDRLGAHFNEMTRVLRARAEEQGRFAAAGELLAGVAHEVNNPLMAIAALAEMRIDDPGLGPGQREEMREILAQTRRASKLLRGLLRFVRAGDRHIARVDVNEVVRGALDLVSYRFGVDEIELAGRFDPLVPAIEVDPVRLEQVVVNLLSNAIDAMRVVPPPRRLTVDTWTDGGRVLVAVEDTGRGIAADVLPRLFLPFSTTKGRRGTGLGLYVSRQLVREAGGDLALDSRSGKGARFILHLPAAVSSEPALAPFTTPPRSTPPADAHSPAAPSAPGRAPANGEPVPSGAGQPAPASAGAPPAALQGIRVLLIDDEQAIRRPLARFLSRRGASVVEAADGEEALQILEDTEPDIILADLRMPRLGGAELHARLRNRSPALADRVLFLSGDLTQLEDAADAISRDRILAKPVELRELEHRLLTFLHRRTAC
jgi:signal transduction histidine kinase/CheY-like chemotaxis protein